ncbi:MAG: hypothetical protein KME21_11565 [Desmonostoc vinosum HA7617-LM4]|jgi:hypothetical protein|nr:hypothetical protein [Desmonostoc vinosum HA7617-LM4]
MTNDPTDDAPTDARTDARSSLPLQRSLVAHGGNPPTGVAPQDRIAQQ